MMVRRNLLLFFLLNCAAGVVLFNDALIGRAPLARLTRAIRILGRGKIVINQDRLESAFPNSSRLVHFEH